MSLEYSNYSLPYFLLVYLLFLCMLLLIGCFGLVGVTALLAGKDVLFVGMAVLIFVVLAIGDWLFSL